MTTFDPRQVQRGYFELLMQSQFWPEDRMREHQRILLEPLLRHARANVPFYATRLDPLFRPDGAVDWDRWHEIPIVKRTDLLDHRQDMLARTIPPGHGDLRDYRSSGSTGLPVTITVNRLNTVMSMAAVYRAHTWHDLDWSKTLVRWFGDDPASALPSGLDKGIWGPGWDTGEPAGRALELNRQVPASAVLDFIERSGASYLGTRPRSVQELALEAIRLGRFIPLDRALTFSTGISDERDDCRAAFGCEMVAHYSSKEGHAMGHQCPSGEHLHVNSDFVFLEVVDDGGRPVPMGGTGRVVITPLFGSAQPLIRYDHGDLAVVGGQCTCGRTLPVLERIAGRTTHLFRFPGGRNVAPAIPAALKKALGAQFWQLAQVAPLHIEVRYVPVSANTPGDEARVADGIRKLTDERAKVTFHAVDSIARSPNDKFIEYVCELPPSAS